MIAQEFKAKGWRIAARGTPVQRYQVFGERSSGTNFVKRLIGRNTGLQPTEDLGWKHGFAQMAAVPEDLAVICVVRDARAWALSMHAKPWHCPPKMQAMDFAAFIRVPWETIADRARYFPQVAALGGLGQPLQYDRHPLTGRAFDNLFALRRAKLEALLSFQERRVTLVLARLEAVQAAPEAFLAELTQGLCLPAPAAPLRPVVKRLGSKFKPAVAARPATPEAMSGADLDWLRAQTDAGVEAALGYRY